MRLRAHADAAADGLPVAHAGDEGAVAAFLPVDAHGEGVIFIFDEGNDQTDEVLHLAAQKFGIAAAAQDLDVDARARGVDAAHPLRQLQKIGQLRLGIRDEIYRGLRLQGDAGRGGKVVAGAGGDEP